MNRVSSSFSVGRGTTFFFTGPRLRDWGGFRMLLTGSTDKERNGKPEEDGRESKR